MGTDEPIYRVQDLVRVFSHGPQPVTAVDRVSFEVPAGQRLGIVGESGSGKSTLIRLMAALDRPTSGVVSFEGQQVSGVREGRLGFLRAAVQLVFQDPRSSLNPRMTVGSIVTEPLRSRHVRGALDPVDAGARLREVGTKARTDIEKLLGQRVYLDLHVKVAKDWQRDPRQLRRLGF